MGSVTTLMLNFGRAFMRICQHSANFVVLRTRLQPSESTHIPPCLCTDDHADARPHGKRQLVSLFFWTCLVVKLFARRLIGDLIEEGKSIKELDWSSKISRIVQDFFYRRCRGALWSQ